VKACGVSAAADEDVFQIWSYLFGRAGAEIANRIESEIYSAFDALAEHPGLGHKRSDLTSAGVLFFAVYEYLVIYRSGVELEIVRVLHGRRDVRRILRQTQL
jgi:toxin ParE1/3/4